ALRRRWLGAQADGRVCPGERGIAGARAALAHTIRSMPAKIIEGKPIAARVRAEVAREVQVFRERTGRAPGLATVLVGEDPGSAVYVGAKQRACAEVGMTAVDKRLPA